jgi:hypothetical protein
MIPAGFSRYFVPFLIFLAPILVVVLARWIFNDIIEVGRIDMTFLPGGRLGQPYPATFIPSTVISSLYNFGFALCAVMVFAVALTVYGSVVVCVAAPNALLRIGFFLMLAAAFAIITFDLTNYRLTAHFPAAIAQNLIDGTLDHLPTCDVKESANLARCADEGIGNTGNSLQRIISLVIGVVLVAGLSYITAIAVVAGSPGMEMDDRIARIENITLLGAMTFLLTIVAVHLLFEPGAAMITAAYAPTPPADIAELRNYASLRSAMTLYWATIFSLALGTAYFCAVTFVQGQVEKKVDFGSVWNVVKALLTVLSPVIADWVLKLGDAFATAAGAK